MSNLNFITMRNIKIVIILQELKKALMMRKTGESEDEFVVNEADEMNDDGDKDSDSGNISRLYYFTKLEVKDNLIV